jgi:hypothetical protein
MRWHKESQQSDPFPSPQAPPAAPVQWGSKPSEPDYERVQSTPEFKRNQIVSEILRMLGTASGEHLAALRDKMADPKFLPGLVPVPRPQGAMPPQFREQRQDPVDRTSPKIEQLRERMQGMDVPPAQTPFAKPPTTREKATMGRPPGMEQFVRQKGAPGT